MIKRTTFLALAFTLAVSIQAAEWPQWRGPHFNGTTDEADLPTEFSRTENVAWSVELPGVGASTPIVWEDKVFISGTDSKKDVLQAMCFDRGSGDLLWQHDLAQGTSKDYRSNFAAASPGPTLRRPL